MRGRARMGHWFRPIGLCCCGGSSCSTLFHDKKSYPTQHQRNNHPNDDEEFLFAVRRLGDFGLFRFGSHGLSFIELNYSHY
jgi:hypothetical protein